VRSQWVPRFTGWQKTGRAECAGDEENAAREFRESSGAEEEFAAAAAFVTSAKLDV
jgi:hypothetical protein